jgi:hypothetical protein
MSYDLLIKELPHCSLIKYVYWSGPYETFLTISVVTVNALNLPLIESQRPLLYSIVMGL